MRAAIQFSFPLQSAPFICLCLMACFLAELYGKGQYGRLYGVVGGYQHTDVHSSSAKELGPGCAGRKATGSDLLR